MLATILVADTGSLMVEIGTCDLEQVFLPCDDFDWYTANKEYHRLKVLKRTWHLKENNGNTECSVDLFVRGLDTSSRKYLEELVEKAMKT